MLLKILLMVFAVAFLASCSGHPSSSAGTNPAPPAPAMVIGGEPVVTLERQRSSSSGAPQFLSVQVLPGKGMNVFQVRAYLPGKGDIDVLGSPSLEEAAKTLSAALDDPYGLTPATMGGPILLPWANRIRGKVSEDGKTIEAMIDGKSISLPANLRPKQPGAEKASIHGLILNAGFQEVKVSRDNDQSSVTAVLHGGNFDGHWFSSTDVNVTTSLAPNAIELAVEAKNVGDQPLPIGIGWHPYFVFPSGDRQQARVHIPAKRRALVNNYDDVFPTGKTEAVKGTPYDFTSPKGAPVGTMYLDNSFIDLDREPDGSVVAEVIDPKANYGLKVIALSKEIRAIQAYSPKEKNFVALEPQFNYVDPYGKEWGKANTGMVVLKPGESVTYHVRLELFTPN